MWESADFFKSPLACAASVAEQIGLSYAFAASPGSSSALSRQNGQSSTTTPHCSLSEGVKAGIGIGAILGAALLIGIGVIITIFFLRRRRHKTLPTTLSLDGIATPETEDQDATLATRKWYLGGQWRSEVEVKNEVGELEGRNVRVVGKPPVELDAEDGGGEVGEGLKST
jgi:hypothetical protein